MSIFCTIFESEANYMIDNIWKMYWEIYYIKYNLAYDARSARDARQTGPPSLAISQRPADAVTRSNIAITRRRTSRRVIKIAHPDKSSLSGNNHGIDSERPAHMASQPLNDCSERTADRPIDRGRSSRVSRARRQSISLHRVNFHKATPRH